MITTFQSRRVIVSAWQNVVDNEMPIWRVNAVITGTIQAQRDVNDDRFGFWVYPDGESCVGPGAFIGDYIVRDFDTGAFSTMTEADFNKTYEAMTNG